MAPLIRASSIRIPRQCGWRFGPVGTSTTTSSGAADSIAPTLWLRRGLSSSAVVQHGSAKSTQPAQTQSPLGKIGVAAALAAATGEGAVKPTLWNEFALRDRVALVSGANRGLGLEMALALVEAGARVVYCVDLHKQPGDEWAQVAEYVRRMETVKGRLEYVCADVTDQKAMWKVGEEIGEREGRMDVCVAAAGILKTHTDCLEYPANQFEEVRVAPMCDSDGAQLYFPSYIQVIRVNTNGVLYTAQAAGRQMSRFGNGGSIILIASMSGSITNKVCCVSLRALGTADKRHRTTRGCLTTRANRPCCRWHGAWRASWARSASGSILSRRGTFTLREWIPVSGAALDPGDGRLHIGVRGNHGAAVIVGI
jgi:NADP-dependent 3-hydroxy acid dehydrogenase YdfG